MSWDVSYYQRGKSLEEKFWEKVDVKDEDSCWEWKAGRSRKGYGNFYTSVGHSKDLHCLAHRMSWKLTNGEIPDGLFVLHTCDNPPCVNPKHLFLGTNEDNMRDMVSKGRSPHVRGSKNHSAKLTEEQVLEIRKLRQSGMVLNRIAKIYSVDTSTIGYICTGRNWKWLKD